MIRTVDTFPSIMDGEAIYSAVAVYHLWSGNDAQGHTQLELFGQRPVRATFDLPNCLEDLAARLPPARCVTARDLAMRCTHVGYLTSFLPRADAEAAVTKMIAGDPSLHLALGINASVVARPRQLRFCIGCMEEMQSQAGRYWWRLDHQLPGVVFCPDHETVLRTSKVGFASAQFTFIAATDLTCPADAAPVVEEPGERLRARLVEIARRSAALLSVPPRFDSYEEITDYYRTRLFEADLMITNKHLNVDRFVEAFAAFHGETLSVLADAFEKMASPDAWVLEMARKHVQAKHPLQHVLFEMFLDQRVRRRSPFGDGPWACPNRVAEHGKGALTITSVAERREGHGIVGTFRCGCGYTYTMSVGHDGILRGPRYRCFGPLLDPALTKVVADGATLRGAAAALGLHPRAIAAAAQRLGLDKGWKVPEKAGSRIGRSVEVPTKDRSVADPSRSRRPAKPRVDWASRDAELLDDVRRAAGEILDASPPVLVSLQQIERRLDLSGSWIYLRRDKLPLTMAFVETVVETVEGYQERRLRAILMREIAAGVAVNPSMLVRSASLKYEVWGNRARQMIEQSMS